MTRRKVDVRGKAATLARLYLSGRPAPRREGGQILVLFTIAIIVIMLFASIVIDLGLLRNNRQILVNAIDGGALAGGTLMPLDGCNNPQNETLPCTSFNSGAALTRYNLVHDKVRDTIQSTYPGITEGATGWQMSYRCLIGIDSDVNPPVPYRSRDIPVVCNPRHADADNDPATSGADHTPTDADFKGAGPTRYSSCYPLLGDKCNVVVVSGIRTTNYSFGRVVGVNQGSTNVVNSAACNGPCGQPPAAPVDLVILIDRTGSMSNTQMGYARDAAKAVLGVYDPDLQRVAVGFAGLSSPNSTCSGSGGGPAVNANAMSPGSAVAPQTGTDNNWRRSAANVNAGATNLDIPKTTTLNNNDVLVLSVSFSSGLTTNAFPPGDNPATVPVEGGWVQVDRTSTPTGTNMSVVTWRKAITNAGGEPASYIVEFRLAAGGANSTVRAAGGVIRYTGVDTTTPTQDNDEANGTDTSGTFRAVAPASNATTNNVAVLGIFAFNQGGTFGGISNGMTEVYDIRNGAALGPSLSLGNKIDGSGSTGSTNNDLTAASGGEWVAQTVVLNPAVIDTYGFAYPADLAKWIPIGFTGTDTDTPAQAWNEAYSDANGLVYDTTHIASAINCGLAAGAQSGIGTNLTTPINMAAQYLQNFGRPNVKWGILFETDGEPNYGGYGSQANEYTCQSAVNAANAAKLITNALGQPIEVFTVGYLDTDPDCPDGTGGYPSTTYNNDAVVQALSHMASTNLTPSPDGGTGDCIAAENTDQDHFFCGPGNADLETTFETIATQFAGIRTHLVQLDPLPVVYNLSVHSGTRLGGTTVVVTGKYFTGVSGVRFGGNNVVCPSVNCTFNNDGQITVISPAGALGTTVEVIVTTPAGSSPLNPGNPGDSFTYT